VVFAAFFFRTRGSLCFSGLAWWLRLAIPLGMLAAGWAAVRDVQFTGDMAPLVRFRWMRNRDALLEAHRRQQATIPAPVAVERSHAKGSDFPEYRGRQRDGIVRGPTLVRDWKAHPPRLLWRQPIGGVY